MMCTDALFHDWSKWETYARKMNFIIASGPCAGKEGTKTETKQRRSCKTCGFAQDQWLRDGE